MLSRKSQSLHVSSPSMPCCFAHCYNCSVANRSLSTWRTWYAAVSFQGYNCSVANRSLSTSEEACPHYAEASYNCSVANRSLSTWRTWYAAVSFQGYNCSVANRSLSTSEEACPHYAEASYNCSVANRSLSTWRTWYAAVSFQGYNCSVANRSLSTSEEACPHYAEASYNCSVANRSLSTQGRQSILVNLHYCYNCSVANRSLSTSIASSSREAWTVLQLLSRKSQSLHRAEDHANTVNCPVTIAQSQIAVSPQCKDKGNVIVGVGYNCSVANRSLSTLYNLGQHWNSGRLQLLSRKSQSLHTVKYNEEVKLYERVTIAQSQIAVSPQ